jgi:ArsR family metal-binding transcriptional regulator
MPYKYRKDLYAAQKRHRIKVRAELYNYLASRCCIDCGESDPVVLEFDHIKPGNKFKKIAEFCRVITPGILY